MSTTFDELLLDDSYSADAEGGPEFATAVIRSGEGGALAFRNENREDYVSRYEIDYFDLIKPRKKELRDFAILRRGMARGFRFLAPDDSELNSENVGWYNSSTGIVEYLSVTDGVKNGFLFIRNYSDPFTAYNRRIIKISPYADFNMALYDDDDPEGDPVAEVTINAEEFYRVHYQSVAELKQTTFIVPGSGLTTISVNYWVGNVGFSPVLPAGLIPRVTCQYHLPVTFGEDWHKFSIDEAGTGKFKVRVDELLPAELGII